jgi:hypothetical protein
MENTELWYLFMHQRCKYLARGNTFPRLGSQDRNAPRHHASTVQCNAPSLRTEGMRSSQQTEMPMLQLRTFREQMSTCLRRCDDLHRL